MVFNYGNKILEKLRHFIIYAKIQYCHNFFFFLQGARWVLLCTIRRQELIIVLCRHKEV